MQNNRIREFGVHLPLSENRDELRGGGTRHAAALGLAERSDALCLVVSEERGTIGIATRGQLEILDNPDAGKLANRIRSYLQHTGTRVNARRERRRWGRRLVEGLLSFALALGAWLIFVPGATAEEAVLQVPVAVENMPEGYALKDVTPQKWRSRWPDRDEPCFWRAMRISRSSLMPISSDWGEGLLKCPPSPCAMQPD